MMILRSFAPAFGAPSPSPFCVKAMCLLTMAGVTWRPDFTADVRKAPHQKLPVLVDGAHTVPDSDAIERHLRDIHGFDFDAGLDAPARGTAHAVKRMAEEHLYFALVYDRWMLDENWAILRREYFEDMPWPQRIFVPGLARKEIIRNTKGQGIGRMSYDEMLIRAKADLEALTVTLGDKPYLFAAHPVAADAAIAPLLASLATGEVETPLLCMVRDATPLMGYVSRVKAAIYPDKSLWS